MPKKHKLEKRLISFAELESKLKSGELLLAPHPKQPWAKEETFRRWQVSQKEGHLQIAAKCGVCSLEFIVLSLRSEIEAMEAYEPDSGEEGGYLTRITCPECGERGKSILLRMRRVAGTICDFAAGGNMIAGL